MKNPARVFLSSAVALLAVLPHARSQGAFEAERPLGDFDNVKARYVPVETSPLTTLALSDDGAILYALNQPGARLVIYRTDPYEELTQVPIGPGAVSVTVRPGTNEVWIADAISGSVIVVDGFIGAIARSVQVGAQPHGIAFSDNGDRAYVACAGVDRVDVIATATYSVVQEIAIAAKQPRSVVFHSGKVYVAPMLSGNNTAAMGDGPAERTKNAVTVQSLEDFPALTQLPDRDVIVIEARALGQDAVLPAETRTGVGTVLFHMKRRPQTDELWIPHTDAMNTVHKGETNFVAGQLVRNRLAFVNAADPQAAPTIFDLDALSPDTISRAAQPTGLAFDPTGSRVFVCGYATDRIAVLDISGSQATWAGSIEIVPIWFNPPTAGPRDAVVDDQGAYLYIHNRIDTSLTRVDLSMLPTSTPFNHVVDNAISLGYDPTPLKVRRGRSHANNARLSKSHTTACDSCHVDARVDGITWDLSAYLDPEGTPDEQLQFDLDVKGPMRTQSLLSLEDSAPYHWRGERPNLLEFNANFVRLLERHVGGVPTPLPGDEFAYIMFYMKGFHNPANPRQQADRGLTSEQRSGARLFMHKSVLDGRSCSACHQPPLGSAGEIVETTGEGPVPTVDVPHLRGAFDELTPELNIGGDFGVRNELGAGLGHAGVYSTPDDFLLQERLDQPGVQRFDVTPQEAAALADLLSAWDTGLAPSTAFLATAQIDNASSVEAVELAYLIEQAEGGHCDLIYRRKLLQTVPFESGLYDPTLDAFRRPSASSAPITPHELIVDAQNGTPVTFLGVPLWLGEQMALDRDLDRILDHDEEALGTGVEAWDTDNDFFPDGYELQWGMNPTVPDVTSPDTELPELVGSPQLVYATQSALKFEFRTSEVVRLLIYQNGTVVQRPPIGPERWDDRFSVVLGALQPDTVYQIDVELFDPAFNTSTETFVYSTRDREFGDPVYVQDIELTTDVGPPEMLYVAVGLRRGDVIPVPGYVVHANVYEEKANGELSMLATDVTGVLGSGLSGVVDFELPLPPQPAQASTLHFVVTGIDAPAGEPPYVRGLSTEINDSVGY